MRIGHRPHDLSSPQHGGAQWEFQAQVRGHFD